MWRIFYESWPYLFSSFAVVAYALDASLSADAMSTWGWRVPFLAATPIGLIGLYLRMSLNDPPRLLRA